MQSRERLEWMRKDVSPCCNQNPPSHLSLLHFPWDPRKKTLVIYWEKSCPPPGGPVPAHPHFSFRVFLELQMGMPPFPVGIPSRIQKSVFERSYC